MKLARVCINTRDIPRTAAMFEKYFGAKAGEIVKDEATDTAVCYLSFADGGELELCATPYLTDGSAYPLHTGYGHVTLSAGSEEKVREITMQIHKDGYTVVNMPRKTLGGRFESMVLDFDGNFIAITDQ